MLALRKSTGGSGYIGGSNSKEIHGISQPNLWVAYRPEKLFQSAEELKPGGDLCPTH